MKFSSRAASDLKLLHRLVYELNRGELPSDCAKIDSVDVAVK